MEGLDYLCVWCKNKNCDKQKLVVTQENDCKTIKCLDFQKDINIAKEYSSKGNNFE